MGPQYDLDAQGRLVNYCLQLVASDAADADKTHDGIIPSDQQQQQDLPPLNPLPTSMSAATSAMASIHQDITNYLSATPAAAVKYGDVQVHLGWKITKAADLGASMGEIKKFVKWKVDAHNRQVARDTGVTVVESALSSEWESGGEVGGAGRRRRFEGAAISRRKRNVGENIASGWEGGYALGVENRRWAVWGLAVAVVVYFFAGAVVESVGDAIDDVVDYVKDIDAGTFLDPIRAIVATVASFFAAIIYVGTAGPKAVLAAVTLLTRIDTTQFLTALFLPMTRIGPVSHPLYYVLLSIYALLFARYLRQEDLMLHEHLADSPLFSQLFKPGFVAYMVVHLLTASLSPVLGADALLLHAGEGLRAWGEEGLRARLGLAAAGKSVCGVAEACPMWYFGGEGAGAGLDVGDDEVGAAVAMVVRMVVAGVLVGGGLDRWWARREIRGVRV